MPSKRQYRVAELIREALARLFLEQDFHLEHLPQEGLTFTEVQISPDLKNATVFHSSFQELNLELAAKQLNEIAPQIRFLLGKMVELRFTPNLRFSYDKRAKHVEEIESLLQQIHEE